MRNTKRLVLAAAMILIGLGAQCAYVACHAVDRGRTEKTLADQVLDFLNAAESREDSRKGP